MDQAQVSKEVQNNEEDVRMPNGGTVVRPSEDCDCIWDMISHKPIQVCAEHLREYVALKSSVLASRLYAALKLLARWKGQVDSNCGDEASTKETQAFYRKWYEDQDVLYGETDDFLREGGE